MVGCRNKKKEKGPGGFGAFERSGIVLLNDSAADIEGVNFKTEPTTPHQIG